MTFLSRWRARYGDTILLVLVCLSGFLIAFDDIAPLRELGGTFAASPAWITLLLCGLFVPAGGQGIWPKIATGLWVFGAAVTAVTFLFLPAEIRGVGVYGKALAVGIPIAVFIGVMIVAARLAAHWPSLVTLFAVISLCTLLLFALLDLAGLISRDGGWLLHGLENVNARARGSRFEASALGAGVLVAVATATLRLRSVNGLYLTAGAVLVLSFLMPSRGTLVSGLAFAGAIVLWALARKLWAAPGPRPAYLASGVLALATLLGGFGLGYLTPVLKQVGLSYSTSDAVRSVWSDAGMDAALHYPAGMGFAAYLDWLPPFVIASMDQFSGQFQRSDFTELVVQLGTHGSSAGFSPKTMPALVGVHFGAIGLIVLVAMWAALGRRGIQAARAGYPMVLPAALALCVITATYFSSIYAWEQAVLLGALFGSAAWQSRTPAGTSA